MIVVIQSDDFDQSQGLIVVDSSQVSFSQRFANDTEYFVNRPLHDFI